MKINNEKNKLQSFREEAATSALAGFHAGILSWTNWNLERWPDFVEGGKPETRRKTLGAGREPTTNSTHIGHRAGIEPETQWQEASALTTAPPLLADETVK